MHAVVKHNSKQQLMTEDDVPETVAQAQALTKCNFNGRRRWPTIKITFALNSFVTHVAEEKGGYQCGIL